MRPYLAVIHDGFRQAFKSWILWILLLMITLLLLGALPLGYREDLTVGLSEGSVREAREFLNRLKAQAAQDQPTPGGAIWSRLDSNLRTELEQLQPLPQDGNVSEVMEQARLLERFLGAVDRQMRDRDFYDASGWSDVQLNSSEAGELLRKYQDENEELSEREVQRLNRLLVEAAFPDQVRASPRTSLQFRYLTGDIGPPLPIRREQFNDLLRRGIAWLLGWVVGGAGVLVAIVVTAPIIPQMFDPGSLYLLLSKPVSRSLLFLSKFLAGCAFILILAAYLIGGAWLILGLRFGSWDPRLLWSIPIYTFVFAVYYSVSALAGVVYRGSILASAIMSISIACLFWLICFSIGTGKIGMETTILNKMRIAQLVPAGDDLLAVNELGFVSRWNEDQQEWEEIFDTEEQRQLRPAMYFIPNLPAELRPVGPVYDPDAKRLLTVQRSFREGKQVVYVGSEQNGWEAEAGATAPSGTIALQRSPQDDIVAVSSLGVFGLRGDPLKKGEPIKVFGMSLPTGGGPFRPIGPDPAVIVTQPSAVAMHPDSGNLALYSRGTLTLLRRTEQGRYERMMADEEVDPEGNALLLAYGGEHVLIAREDGRLELYAADSLGEKPLLESRQDFPPRFAYAAPGGRWFAVVLHSGELVLLDVPSRTFRQPPLTGQGDISAALFADNEQILVADRTSRVTRYRTGSWESLDRFSPKMGMMEASYRYVLKPLYTVFPKPGELNKTFQYVLSGEATTTDRESAEDLTAARTRLRPWAPLWSSLAFMAVVLLLACVYIERQQF